MSKTYFNHTSKLNLVKAGLRRPATIAIARKGDEFIYGVTICSKYDNFKKSTGRTVAENRMLSGFASMKVPEVIKDLPERESCLAQLYNLTESVVLKTKKWKGKITKFNQTMVDRLQKSNEVKLVDINTKYSNSNNLVAS